jgi:hypothetical protein
MASRSVSIVATCSLKTVLVPNVTKQDFHASDTVFDGWLSSVLTAWYRSLLSAGLLIRTRPLSCWSAMAAFSPRLARSARLTLGCDAHKRWRLIPELRCKLQEN